MRKNNIHIRCSLLYTDFSFLELADQKKFFNILLNLCINECLKNKSEMRQIFISSKIKKLHPYLHLFLPSTSEKLYLLEKNKDLNELIKKYNIIFFQKLTTTDTQILHVQFIFKLNQD